MAEYRATISWETDGQFSSGLYSRRYRMSFDGGAEVIGSSAPSSVRVPLSDPAGVDPEEALVASASACHMLWFLSLAQAAGHDVASYRDEAVAKMGKDERGKIALTRIALRPTIKFASPEPAPDELARLHEEAHERCFIANSLRTPIVVEPPLA